MIKKETFFILVLGALFLVLCLTVGEDIAYYGKQIAGKGVSQK